MEIAQFLLWRMNIGRITQESIMNWGKRYFDNKMVRRGLKGLTFETVKPGFIFRKEEVYDIFNDTVS
jgi:hypothetical protein